MISRWKWMLKQTFKKLWFRATLFAIVAIITALLSILFKSMIPESVSVKVGAEAVDNILNILAGRCCYCPADRRGAECVANRNDSECIALLSYLINIHIRTVKSPASGFDQA